MARIAPAVPARSRARSPITAELFGERKRPSPTPKQARTRPISQIGEAVPRKTLPIMAAVMRPRATRAGRLEPLRSLHQPATGETSSMNTAWSVMRMPVAPSDHCMTSCRYRGNRTAGNSMSTKERNAATFPNPKTRRRNNPRSMTGPADRASWATNSPRNTNDAPSSPSVSTWDQPALGPAPRPRRSELENPANRSAPNRSNSFADQWPTGRSAGRKTKVPTAPSRPMGTLMRKIERHPKVSVSTPPSPGPTMVPAATTLVRSPRTRPRSPGGKVVTAVAMIVAMNIDAPTPCRTRAAVRRGKVGARATSRDAITKIAKPVFRMRLRPTMSASRPDTGRTAVTVRK